MVHVAIIGAYGSAGVAVADELIERARPADDLELTLVDDGDPGGGLCILRGCMPSKDVLSAGQHASQARHDDRLEATVTPNLEAIIDRKDDHVSNFAAHRRAHVHDLADRDGVELIRDSARFVDDRVLAVGDRTIEPDYVVIATGSTLDVPDLPGIDGVDFMDSADVLDARSLPDSGIVMGFGYIGLELVPYLSEIGGMDLTVIEHDDRPLHEMPPEYGETILDIYRSQYDIEILTNADEKQVSQRADGRVTLEVERDDTPETHEADQLFCFTGRRPNIDNLGLETTRIEPESEWVTATMQTRADERVFIAGDANAREPILHVAKEQGFVAGRNILRHHRQHRNHSDSPNDELATTSENDATPDDGLESYTSIPHHVIFSGLAVYPFTRIGHTPQSVADTEMDAVVVSREAASDGVFKTKGHPEGAATLVVSAADGTVLGYQGLHLHADVMAKTMQVVIELGLDVRSLPDRAYHPTTPEILDGLFRDAAAELEARSESA